MKWLYPTLLLFLVINSGRSDDNTTVTSAFNDTEVPRFQIITFKWDTVRTPIIISTWLLVAAIAKIVFNMFKPLVVVFPDSSLLIIIGLGIGKMLQYVAADVTTYNLDSHVFFLYLLPPIIFDAGYFMPNRALFENIDSVLLFSVVGTIWNTIAIGGSLLALGYFGVFSMGFSTFEIFVFSALISAVDPVAVIAVFEELHVKEFLFVNVFGEALFNDGVTVVLYQMFKSFALIGADKLTVYDYGSGAVSFFVVAMGGTAIGLIFAILVSIATKHTYNVRILAPVFIFVFPYIAYLTAEMLSLSSIIAIAVCGMVMKQYVKGNITQASANSVKYFTKMLAQSSETVIFVFLGLSTIASAQYHWDFKFVAATIFFCLLWRTAGVIGQCWFLNKFRHKKFTKIDQFVLSYGGLRGAIAFGLAVSIPNSIQAKEMFITTTIAVIYFTVFLQGITIRPLVKFLNVETEEIRTPTLTESIYGKYLMYMMSGVEDIAGQKGHYTFRENYERFNAKILRPLLMRNEKKRDFDASTIVRAYAKITLEDAMNLTNAQKTKKLEKIIEETSFGEGAYANRAFEREQQLNQMTVTPRDKQLQNFMQSNANVEGLYSLFSDLLDRKLKEMNVSNKVVKEPVHEDDIEDDYMKQLDSTNNLRGLALPEVSPERGRNQNRIDRDRRQSTGGLPERKKTFHM